MAETTFRLRVWTRYFESVEAVWAHKTAPGQLWPWLRLAEADRRALQAAVQSGQPRRATGRLAPGRLAWSIELLRAEPPHLLEGRSENVLFSRFEHRHILEAAPDGCRYIDDVVFAPRGPSAKLAAVALKRLLVRRHRADARALRPDQRTVGTSVLRVLIEEDED